MKTHVLGWLAAAVCCGAGLMLQAENPPRTTREATSTPASTAPATAPAKPVKPAFSEAQENELMNFLKAKRPDYYEKLNQLRQSQNPNYKNYFKRSWSWYEKIKSFPPDMQDTAMAEQDIRVNIWRINNALRTAKDPAEKSKLTEDLRKEIARQFDVDLKLKQHSLNQFEERINAFRAELAQRAQNKDKILADSLRGYLQAASQPVKHAQPPKPPDGGLPELDEK